MNLAVIPARGGSKRIPRKNVRPFAGRPMIAWSITAALDSGCFDRVVVSTDDDEIADVARHWGAEVPFMRPADLADDRTATIPVIAHAIEWIQEHAGSFAAVCCIYATAPMVQPDDIRRGLRLLEETGADYVFPVTSFPHPIQRALRLGTDHRVEMFHPEHYATRSQDLEPAYHDAGQFYWGRPQAWLQRRAMFGPHAVGLPIPRHRVQDIDTPEDWERAELLYHALRRGHTAFTDR